MNHSAATGEGSRQGPLVISIADDVPEIRKVACELLNSAGYQVHSAADGTELRNLARTRRLDLVLTDILMPESDGFEVIAALRETNPHVRIIAMSRGGHTTNARDCLRVARRLGADAILTKPFTGAQLVETIEAVCRRARRDA